MKADVLPTPADTLVIPSWVPDIIAQSVSARYAADVELIYKLAAELFDLCQMPQDDFVKRGLARKTECYLPLACDPKMESVWWELSKHDLNGGFLHPAIGIDRDAALLELFNIAVMCREQGHETTITQRQAKQQREHYLAKAKELRGDALMLLVDLSRDNQELCRKLAEAARGYEIYADAIYKATMPMASERKPDDSRARWVALTIGSTFRKLFKDQMNGLTAIITSVVTGREIDLGTVRYWLGHPCS